MSKISHYGLKHILNVFLKSDSDGGENILQGRGSIASLTNIKKNYEGVRYSVNKLRICFVFCMIYNIYKHLSGQNQHNLSWVHTLGGK